MKTSELMPIEFIDDWEKRIARQEAFWYNEIIDRPVICISIPVSGENSGFRRKYFNNHRDRWFDAQYFAESCLSNIMNTKFYGDALPIACPNLGPEVLSAFFGMELEFGERTSWGIPNLTTMEEVSKLRFSEDNEYFRKIVEITETLLEFGRGKFYVGMTDFHPGGDALAAFRDPQNLNFDLIECPEKVKSFIRWFNKEYFKIFDFFHEKLVNARQAITNWTRIVSNKKWYVQSNDFSCMISKKMFDDIFLPGIIEECQRLEVSIYHLDGPGALHHLESLLEIKELNAIQWVYGAGNGSVKDWLHVYKKCQNAGKAIQISSISVDEIDLMTNYLKPEGVWLSVSGVKTEEEAKNIIRKISKWK